MATSAVREDEEAFHMFECVFDCIHDSFTSPPITQHRSSSASAPCLLCVDLGTSFLMAELQLLCLFKSLFHLSFSTVSQTTRWRLISGTLGVICVLLMATLGILLKLSFLPFTELSIEPTLSPGPNIEFHKGSDCCSCPEKWVGYRCNCYFISSELKTWEESRNFCVSQNSSLLQLQNRDELGFMHSSERFYWIGLSYNEERGDWLWEDGSAPSRDLFSSLETPGPKNCIVYKPMNDVVDEPCERENRYICKQQLI
ncbi:natural killer cells antigen CD94-like [Lemur catta]|uniref:natural killer cells antigen CD94-like n=1 Tax=Lemur catta TaxID=9447 RepID=UPI001E26E000|nr:natural killer cells antigen CD94-like [Lemur catta]